MARPTLAILLPPSEGKAIGGRAPGWDPASGAFGGLEHQRRAVARALTKAKGGDEKLLGARGDTLARSRDANRHVIGGPVLPASQRFTGVVWDALDLPSLDRAARTRARRSVFVVCALAGVVALDDPLPDFRLKLSVSLPPLGKLSTYWRDAVTEALDARLAGRLVIDLLPAEHAAAWSPDPTRYDHRRIRFVDRDGRTTGHAAKAVKGRLAHALLAADDPARALTTFRDDEFSVEVVDR